jgi:hypothetical protein
MGLSCTGIFGKNNGLKKATINEMEGILRQYKVIADQVPHFTFTYTVTELYNVAGINLLIQMYANVNGHEYRPTMIAYNTLGPETLTTLLAHVDWLLQRFP